MGNEQFDALMPYISADLIEKISDRRGITEQEALNRLYGSRLYAMLEDEETKVWQYSTDMLYALFQKEEETGSLVFPDV